MAAKTKHHRLGDLNNRNVFSHSSGSRKAKIKVQAKFVFPEISLLALPMAVFSGCLHVAFSLCAHIPGVYSTSYVLTLVLLD